MPHQFEKFREIEEMENIKPTPIEKKKPIELTKEEDEYFVDLLKKAKEAEKKGDLEQAIKLYLQYKEEYKALREKKEGKKEEKEEKEEAEIKEPIPEAKLEGAIAEQIETAIEILGKENVFGPKEVEATFGVHVREVPGIPFSMEELERAKKLGQMLVLRVESTDDGTPMSLETMNNILVKKWEKENKGQLLDTVKGWKDWIGDDRFKKEVPRPGWALVSKGLLMHSEEDEKKYGKEEAERLFDSTDKNYIEQTEVIINTLREKAFKDIEIPEEYKEAIQEFESNKERLTQLMMDKNSKEAAKQLTELKITKLTRQTFPEMIYDVAMYYDRHNKRLFEFGKTHQVRYVWSASLVFLDRYIISIGRFDAKGFDGTGWKPTTRSFFLGVSLSRRL